MSTPAGRSALTAFSLVALAACGAAQSSAPPAVTERICAGTHQPGPAPSLDFTADGHPTNSWSLPVEADGVTVRFRITQRPKTTVTTVRFVIAPANGRFPGSDVRTFAPVGKNWTPGEHSATVTWDGKDDDGRRVAAGKYRLFAEAITTTTRDVKCADGGGAGVERFTGTHEAAGLGRFTVRGNARPCPNERDFNDPRLTQATEDVLRSRPASWTPTSRG